MKIRRWIVVDEATLFRLFCSAIRTVSGKDYTTEQSEAWAPEDFSQDPGVSRIREIQPFVVEIGNEIGGYADVQQDGYIDHFFESGAHGGQGIGKMLMARIQKEAITLGLAELTSNVSKTAEP